MIKHIPTSRQLQTSTSIIQTVKVEPQVTEIQSLSFIKLPAKAPVIVQSNIPEDTKGKEYWDSRVRYHCTLRGLDCERVLRIMYCESGGRANAKNPNSSASGLFQQLARYWPARAAQYGVPGTSPFDGEANIIVSLGMMQNGMWSHWVCK